MTHFDEVPRRIRWSEIEFSHRLSPEPTPIAPLVPHSRRRFLVRRGSAFFVRRHSITMKIVRSIICLTLFIFNLSAFASEDFPFPIYQRVSGYGITNIWFVAKSQIEKTAGWDEKGEPPLPVGKAVSLAKAWVVSKGGSTNSYVVSVIFRSAAMGEPTGSSSFRRFWFYTIRFHEVYQFGSGVTCVVLSDGSIVEPESTPHVTNQLHYLD
jgi:hypothetical protein